MPRYKSNGAEVEMLDNSIVEATMVLCTYGVRYLFAGLIGSFLMVLWGSRRNRRANRVAILVCAIIVLWVAVFAGVDSGYRAWQSIPQPPEEAFSDTGGPFFAIFLGWLPSTIVLSLTHVFLRAHKNNGKGQARN